jgi:hypothetical protein
MHWSDDMYCFFKGVDDDWFIYTMEDNFLVDTVNLENFKKIKTYMVDNVGRIDLTDGFDDHRISHHDYHGPGPYSSDLQLIERDQAAPYRGAFTMSIWCKKYLLNMLNATMLNPWQVEAYASSISKYDGVTILGTKASQAIAPRNEGVSTKEGFKSLTTFRLGRVKPEYIQEMAKLKILTSDIQITGNADWLEDVRQTLIESRTRITARVG